MPVATRRAIPGLYSSSDGPRIHSDWWDIGPTCLGAWSPITASSAATAVIDQTGGDNHLRDGSGNIFIKGVGLSGSAKYNQNAVADYTRLTFVSLRYDGGVGDLFGVREDGRQHYFYPYYEASNRRYWGLGTEVEYKAGRLSSGSRYTLAIRTTDGYLNGSLDFDASFWLTGETEETIAFNGSNGEGTSHDGCSMVLECAAIYSGDLSAAYVTTLHNAAVALRS